ncbi:hypothetical protein B7463_g7746, partial [Scytalidium lignicola]
MSSTPITYALHPDLAEATAAVTQRTIDRLGEVRGVQFCKLSTGDDIDATSSFFEQGWDVWECFGKLSTLLIGVGRKDEADALRHVLQLCQSDKEVGGFGMKRSTEVNGVLLDPEDIEEILFLVDAWLEALNSAERSRQLAKPVIARGAERRGMTLSEKILAHHTIQTPSEQGVKASDVVQVAIDWIIASELSWVGMKKTFVSIGKPKIWRNDRFWLAGDHVIDPRISDRPGVQMLAKQLKEAKKEFRMTENQGSNYTILHTEFVRERAEPGMLILGSDSHSCSAGAVGCLGIGLGAADVMMSLVTGETWFKVPQSIKIALTGQPMWYIKGKDVILYILKKLKRNTAAADRIVEFTGTGARFLSCDARFAVCNMCTELGAITGVFVPDEVTYDYINARSQKANKSSSLYFQPDEDAVYAETFEIDLSEVESFLALYPSPDDVVPVTERLGMKFDGCFIGACTTTEEDLILAALVLQVGLKKGLSLAVGKRHVVPGSLPIVKRLRDLGLLQVYEDSGFTRALPGCSYCIGMGADQAVSGEKWLSSQNRNFKNRMGKGEGPSSIGNICSAATVAASSFSMTLTDPAPFLAEVDFKQYAQFLQGCRAQPERTSIPALSYKEPPFQYVEPHLQYEESLQVSKGGQPEQDEQSTSRIIKSKVYALGDFIDTDALAPGAFIVASTTDEELGDHVLQYTHPDFRDHVRSGHEVVVAGRAFGCGSSREEAPRALKALGVKCVIAKTFSFIYGRNQPNLALLGINIVDDEFYSLATTGAAIKIDIPERVILVGGKYFPFVLDEMELRLIENKGLAAAFTSFGRSVFQALCGRNGSSEASPSLANTLDQIENKRSMAKLEW